MVKIMFYKIFRLKHFIIISVLSFVIMLMVFSNIGASGTTLGLKLCASVIIPSLFPYTFAILFLMRLNISSILTPFEKIIKKLFKMNKEMFFVFILSLLGGYPSGAKLVNELYKDKKIDEKTANNMLIFCVNAGPGFVVIAIGNRILNSSSCGLILLFSHITVSLLFALIFKNKNSYTEQKKQSCHTPLTNCFTSSVTDSANTVLNICFYVVLFSVINAYLTEMQGVFYPIKFLSYLTEISSSVNLTRNIYLISFLLGFSGISIWCQIFATANKFKINITKFVLFRVLHGTLSAVLTFALIKVFKPVLPTISNNTSSYFEGHTNTVQLTVALILMIVILIISIENKITCRKIKEDLL